MRIAVIGTGYVGLVSGVCLSDFGHQVTCVDRDERKLAMLHRSTRLDDLRIPPNNRLEALKGDRAGQFSIRINDQWRLCFRYDGTDAHDVEIVDYH